MRRGVKIKAYQVSGYDLAIIKILELYIVSKMASNNLKNILRKNGNAEL